MATTISDDSIGIQIRNNIHRIIPVICDDVFEWIDQNGQSLSMKEFIYSLLAECYGECIMDMFRNKNIYHSISYFENIRNTNVNTYLHDKISEATQKKQIRLKGIVKDFLIAGDFPIIITTFGFPLIEKIFQEATGITSYSEWYNPSQRNDLPIIIKKDNPPVIYHIFGGETPYSWVYNEQTLLKFMHKLHDGDYSAKNLSNYLCTHNKHLLIIGSSFPDWLFRFLIYPISERNFGQTDGYWLSLNSIEDELDFFLARNKYHGQKNLQEMERIDHILNNAISKGATEKGMAKPTLRYNIFVSYKREKDSEERESILNRVIQILKKQGEVWLDVKEVSDGGNPYWANIKRAIIDDCNLFVPLVTGKYLNEFKNVGDWDVLNNIPCEQTLSDDANDGNVIQDLPPVVREAYYALQAKKARDKTCNPIRFCPIVIVDEKTKSAGNVEKTAKHKTKGISLPPDMFSEKTMQEYNDCSPKEFNLPQIIDDERIV